MNDQGNPPQSPDAKAFWRWVLTSVRPVAGWLLVGLGALVLFLAWIGVSGEVLVSKQLPYLVSGGFGGLGMIILGTRMLVGEDLRSYDSRLRRMEHLVDDLHELVLVDDTRPSSPADEWASTESTELTGATPSTNGARVAVLQTGSSFHLPRCRLVRDKVETELLPPSIAVERGMKPCGVCHPPTPALTAAPVEH